MSTWSSNFSTFTSIFLPAQGVSCLCRGMDLHQIRRRVTLTLRCVHDENEIGSSLIAAIGSCKALKQLRLDLDTTMSSGGCGFYALGWFFLGKMGEHGCIRNPQNGTKWEMERKLLKPLKTTYLCDMNDYLLRMTNTFCGGKWPTKPGDQSFKWWYTIPYAVNHQDNWFIVYVYGSIQNDENGCHIAPKYWKFTSQHERFLQYFCGAKLRRVFLCRKADLESKWNQQILVGGLEPWNFMTLPIILGISSSQLTFTPSFFRGVAKNHQNYVDFR